jgi:hypothetical protein
MKLKVSVAIERGLIDRLDKIAGVTHASRSQVIERMLLEQIAAAECFANVMANPEARDVFLKEFMKSDIAGPILRGLGHMGDKAEREAVALEGEGYGKAVESAKKGKGKKS